MASTVKDSIFKISMDFITDHNYNLLEAIGIQDDWIKFFNLLVILFVVVILIFLLQKLVNYSFSFLLRKVSSMTNISIFKTIIKNRLPHFLGLFITYTFIVNVIPVAFSDYSFLIKPLLKITDIYIVFIVIWTVMSIVKSFVDNLQEKPAFANKPMKSYVQVIQIIFYIIGAVVIFCILTGKSATVFFTAMGAASAVLMLMFKDTIMGFVSSIQISTNEMVMIGDWITMGKYGADGTVEEINLTTVKVRNFDKTITTIPTYGLISDSFQNWRGMQDSGGRRLKRSLIIKQSDIRNLTDTEIDTFEKSPSLSSYIKEKRKKYAQINKDLNLDNGSVLKGVQITNCDLFVIYATWFLKNNTEIKQDMTLMVRQMAPTVEGLPIEIYVFTNTTVWTEYERIAGEIFTHLIPVVKIFGLTIFETSAGTDQYNVYMHDTVK